MGNNAQEAWDKSSWWVVPPFLVSIGILYLIGYWQEFKINPFQYADLTTIVTSCIAPIFSSTLAYVVGVLLSMTFSLFPPSEPPIRTQARTVAVLVWTVAVVFILTYLIIYSGLKNKWIGLPPAAVFALTPFCVYFEVLKNRVPQRFAGTVALLLIYLPMAAFCAGKEDAIKIISSQNYIEANNGNSLKYLGHINGNFFLISQDNKTLKIISGSAMDAYTLREVSQ